MAVHDVIRFGGLCLAEELNAVTMLHFWGVRKRIWDPSLIMALGRDFSCLQTPNDTVVPQTGCRQVTRPVRKPVRTQSWQAIGRQ